MDNRKLSSVIIVLLLVSSIGHTLMSSDNVEAAFIMPLSNNGMSPNFTAEDTVWNDAGTMAVVVGYDTAGGPNAYVYYYLNDTYVPLDNGGFNGQRLYSADYYAEAIYGWAEGTKGNSEHLSIASDTVDMMSSGGIVPPEPTATQITLFTDSFRNNLGWTYGTNWQRGVATISPPATGNPDPGTDHTIATTDNMTAGALIGGNVGVTPEGVHGFYYLTSPAVDCTGISYVGLNLWRWLNSDYSSFMDNQIEVFNGATWNVVWLSGPAPAIQDGAWTNMDLDISAYAANVPNMQVRIGYTAAAGSWTVSGWNVDDVLIYTYDYSCSLSPAFQTKYGLANTVVDHMMTVTNQGLNDDTYDLSYVNNNLPWPVTFLDESNTAMNVGPWLSTYPAVAQTRGYWFTAPCDFIITKLRVPTDVGLTTQNIQVIRFNFAPSTNSYTSLGYWNRTTGSAWITCNIEVHTGEIIGILGARGTTTMYNSYGSTTSAITPYNTTINGNTVGLRRLTIPKNLHAGPAISPTDSLSTGTGPYARIEMEYVTSTINSISALFGESKNFRARVSIPGGAVPGDFDIADIYTTSQADPLTMAMVQVETRVPLTITNTVPANGATGVGLTSSVVATFAGQMNTGSVGFSSTPDPNPGGWSAVWSGGDTIVTYSHPTAFLPGTTYLFQITSGTDMLGNSLMAGAVPNPWTFTTATPTATATGPTGGPTTVVSVTLTYTYANSPTSVNIYYTKSTVSPWAWVSAGNDPTVDGSFAYTIIAGSGSYRWLASAVGGNSTEPSPPANTIAPESGTYILDLANPSITNTNPANNTNGIALNQNIVITFSEAMNTASFAYTCNPDPGLAVVWNSPTNTIATLAHTNFAYATTYTFNVTAATDVAGNSLIAGAVPNPWTFTTIATASATATGPISATRTNIAAVTITYTLAGDTPIWVNLYYTTNGGTSWTLAGNDTTPDGSFDWVIPLSGTYTIGWIAQAGGGGSAEPKPPTAGTTPEATPYMFDTAIPTITSRTPASGAVNVAVAQNVLITFSEAMNTGSVSYTCTPNPGGWSASWNTPTNTQLTLTHTLFPYYTQFTFTVTAATDVAGNSLTVPNFWLFTTIGAATATGPLGTSNQVAVTLTYTNQTTPPPTYVHIYYTKNTVSPYTWVLAGNDTTVDGSFAYTITAGAGNYRWLASGGGCNSSEPLTIPGTTIAPESGYYILDLTAPTPPTGLTVEWGGLVPQNIYFEDFEGDGTPTFAELGWVTGGASNDWEIGTPSGLGGQYGNPDPVGAYSGASSIGNDLSGLLGTFPGDYEISLVADSNWICSPAIDCTGYYNIYLSFWRYLNIEQPMYDHAYIEVSNDGVTYTQVWTNTAQITDAAWNYMSYNISAVASNHATVYIRFEIGPTDGSWQYSGWNIDDLDLSGQWTLDGSTDNNILNWALSSDDGTGSNDVSYYKVYRSMNQAGPWDATAFIANVPARTGYFIDMNRGELDGINWWYVIRAVDIAGNEEMNTDAVPEDPIPPTIISTIPASGMTGVAINQNIVVTFSEEMNPLSLNYTCSPNPGGWSAVWTLVNRVVLSHTDFLYGTTYTFTVTAAEDLAGNSIVAGAVPNPWSFTTIPTASATATGPTGGPTNVAGITLTYSRISVPTSVNIYYTTNGGTSWTLAGNDASVDGFFAWTVPASGTYGWYASAVGAGSTELPPTPGTSPEISSYIYDGIRPTVSSVVPVNTATSVAITQSIQITFSEPINTATFIIGTSFTISPNPGGLVVAWSGGNTIATITHTNFAYNTLYSCTITTGVADVAGNTLLANYAWSFRTIVAATATATGPISAGTNVVAITMTYTYTGAPTSVNLYFTMNGGTTWNLAGNDVTVDGSFAYTIVSGSGTYGWYASAVGGGTVEPSPPAGGTVPEATAYVLDVTRPAITVTNPVSAATGVAIAQNVVITFSEAINTLTFAYNIAPNPGGLGVVWSGGNTIATISHTAFAYGTSYTVTVTVASDIYGNLLNAGAVPNPWTFTTIAQASATATGPTGGPTNVGAITITYTYTGVPTSVNLYYTTNGGSTWNYFGNDGLVDGSMTIVLGTSGTYGWIMQAVGGGTAEPSPPAGSTPPESASYIFDNVRPTVSTVVPVNSAINVAVTQNIVITFSEPVNTATFVIGSSFTINPNPGGLSVVWSGGNTIATITHTNFAYDTLYSCTITTGVADAAGNTLLANYAWSFRTIVVATATATGPISAPTNVASITITYTYTGAPTSVNLYYTVNGGTTWIFWSNDATVDGSFITGVGTSGTYGWIAQAVGGGSTESPPAGGTPPESGPYVFDNVAPTIISVSPINGATGVDVTQSIVITFSESMGSVSYGIDPPAAYTSVWGTLNYPNDQIILTPTPEWAYGTTYTVTVGISADVAGNLLVAGAVPNPWSFTTELPATATATGPTGGPTNVATVTLTYTWTGTPTSVNLYYTINGGTSWTIVGNDATVDGSFAWTVSASGAYGWYASAVGGGSIESSPPAGGTPPEAMSYVFDNISPTITATNPISDSTGVAVSQSIVITFSEAMDTLSIAYSCNPDPGGWSTPGWSVGNTVLTFSHSAFAYNTTYTFTVTAGNDVAGNPLVAGAVPNPWSFITAAGATATATGPASGPTTVGAVLITYTWTGIPTSVNVYYTTNGGIIWTLANNDPTVDGSFGFTMAVSGSYSWYVSAVGGGSTEPSPPTGGTLPEAGIYYFDVTAPFITSVSPAPGATNVLGNALIVINFNEPLDIAMGIVTLFPNPGGGICSWSNGNRTLTVTHNNFPENTLITVNASMFEDVAGNQIDPLLTSWSFTITEMGIIGYRDVFWICGNNTGGVPATVYKFLPQTGMQLIPMNDAAAPEFRAIAVDNMGNPLCGGPGGDTLYYFDGTGWITQTAATAEGFEAEGIDFNPNDNRFYLVGYIGSPSEVGFYYTESTPLSDGGTFYRYQTPGLTDDITMRSIAWNHLYNYGLAVGDSGRVVKVWPYSYYNNGTMRYQRVASDSNMYQDISWDSDGWNEVGIVGSKSGNRAYWRYYHSNPKLIEGYVGDPGMYLACAMKPPCSPKWLFVPFADESIKVQIMEKDESDRVIMYVDKPHIFEVDIWKQSDFTKSSVLGTSTDANSTYTIFIDGNYTLGGWDYWDPANLQLNISAWYDHGQIGTGSAPGNSSDSNRTRQFTLTYSPGNMPVMQFPSGAPNEFSIHSYHESTGHGADGSHRWVYINVTFGPQTIFSNGSFAQATTNPWSPNTALNDLNTWDFNVTLQDINYTASWNSTYGEFGVKKFASISSGGNPTGSVPPGSTMMLASPNYFSYSINAPYTLNVSIPNLLKNGDPSNNITAVNVEVNNTHVNANASNSEISLWTSFSGPDQGLCIWGRPGEMMQPTGNGTVSDITEVWWRVTVPVSTQEGVYRATITITLWS